MWCKIISIEKQLNYNGKEILVIKFNFGENLKYTKLSKSALDYWKNVRKIQEFKVEQEINVIEQYNDKYKKMLYKIIEVK